MSVRDALEVPDPGVTDGRAILVYDVFTDGFTLSEVARCLRREGGAARSAG